MSSKVFLISCLLILSGLLHAAIEPLSDQDMRQTSAQALLNLSYVAPSGVTGSTTDFGFYKLGIQGNIDLNANIRTLKLGCDGLGACDIDGANVSFGCVTNAAGLCIPVSGTNSNTTVSSTAARTGMRDFTLTNPFIQLAIKNPDSASTREFSGFRLGADRAKGPLSFGTLTSFSGFLTAQANLTIQAGTDIAVTCKAPTLCPNAAGQSEFTNAAGYLGLNDKTVLATGLVNAKYSDLTIDYQGVSRTGLSVLVAGKRQSQAKIGGLQLSSLVDQLAYGSTDPTTPNNALALQVNRNQLSGLAGFLVPAFITNSLLPVLRDTVALDIKQQLATGLGVDPTEAGLQERLNAYELPYNVSNLHEAELDTNLFGLSFQKTDIQYPEYSAAVSNGWSLFLPNAFTLDINQSLPTLVSNIVRNTNARDGNILSLQPANVNCYGTLTFC
jgi:hypothetical protein